MTLRADRTRDQRTPYGPSVEREHRRRWRELSAPNAVINSFKLLSSSDKQVLDFLRSL